MRTRSTRPRDSGMPHGPPPSPAPLTSAIKDL
jgi:hypothetical protein